jgi:hypothetical protein
VQDPYSDLAKENLMIGQTGGVLFKIGAEVAEQIVKQTLKTIANEAPKVLKSLKKPKRV